MSTATLDAPSALSSPTVRAGANPNGDASHAPAVATPPAHVFIGMPNYGSMHPLMVAAVTTCTTSLRLSLWPETASLLAYGFNKTFALAMNNRKLGITHFCMLHSDIAPEPGWLDVLMAEMERTGADVVSAVSPMKDARGLTTTGVLDRDTCITRRFTLRECFTLPETFSLDDCLASPSLNVEAKKPCLAVNTGCFLWRLNNPKCEEFTGFSILDRVNKLEDGTMGVNALSEDWNWSRWCADNGLKVVATRKVKLTHYGMWGWRNDTPDFGTLTGPDPGDISLGEGAGAGK